MDRCGKNEYSYANKFARLTIEALQEVMGKNGVNSVLRIAGLTHLLERLPPDNLDTEFSYTHYSAIFQALEDLYGPHGGRGLALRAGRASFPMALREFGQRAGIRDLAFKVIPYPSKLRISLTTASTIANEMSDQKVTVTETPYTFLYSVKRCPSCWGRKGTDKPVCFFTTGFIMEGLKWVSGGQEFRVVESRCSAMGEDACEFAIPKEPIS